MEQYPSDNFIPQREPNEVTLEYVAEPKPYVAYYVQDRPLPGRKPEAAAQEPPARTRRKRHRGLKIFLICLAAVLVLTGGLYAAWWFGLLPDRFYGGDHGDYYDDPDYYYYYGELDESAEPELPVISADDGVRLVYADGHGDALTIQEIYRRVNPSTVTVVTELPRGASVGTGVILTKDGYIITNNHVVEGAQSVSVQLNDGTSLDATIVGTDEQTDLAVIKVSSSAELTAAEFGDSDQLQPGEYAYAIGSPGGVQFANTITGGRISAINRDLTVNDRVMSLIQTDASINNGNSGGALINEYGQVVGITSAKLSGNAFGSATVEGMGFAIPINTAKDIVDEIIQNGYVSGRPSIGITGQNVESADGKVSGVQVYSIDSRAKAASEGLQVGDVITAVDGTPTPTMDDVNTVKEGKKAGDKLTLSVYRISTGKTLNITVTLTDAHDLEGDDPAETQQQSQSQNDNYGNYGNGYGSFGGFSSPFSSFGW